MCCFKTSEHRHSSFTAIIVSKKANQRAPQSKPVTGRCFRKGYWERTFDEQTRMPQCVVLTSKLELIFPIVTVRLLIHESLSSCESAYRYPNKTRTGISIRISVFVYISDRKEIAQRAVPNADGIRTTSLAKDQGLQKYCL